MLGASGMEKKLYKYTNMKKETPRPVVLLYLARDENMDCLGQAGNLLHKMSRKHTIRIWNF